MRASEKEKLRAVTGASEAATLPEHIRLRYKGQEGNVWKDDESNITAMTIRVTQDFYCSVPQPPIPGAR
jgi:hypothetical protein